VLDYLEQWMDQAIVQRLHSSGKPLLRLQQMCDRLGEAYEGGKQPCLSAILLLGSARDRFHDRVQALYHVWIDAIVSVLAESGMDRALAQRRGEDAVIAIQGALILSQGLNDAAPFQRVMQQLPRELCQDM
jgi:TetR/AcrR family transcriptional regulator, lmrAB and yxaGH operons repressor